MISRLLGFLALLFPIAAHAETIALQIGEQAEATRVMLPLPPDSNWTVIPDDGQIIVTIDTATSYEISAINGLGEDSRVRTASSGPVAQSLIIALRCRCDVESYVVNDRFLTIDVSDPLDFAGGFTLKETFDALRQPWHNTFTIEEPSSSSRFFDPTEQPTADALDTEVSSGLARATYQGFLELRDGIDAPPDLEVAADLLANIAIGVDAQLQTIIDSDAGPVDPIVFNCSEVQSFLDDAWVSDRSLSLQLAAVNRRMVSPDESYDPEALRDLAIVLVGHGFGVEAISVLDMHGDQSDLSKALRFMSNVIDNPASAEPVGLSSCDEGLAIWSYLDDPEGHSALDPKRLMITYKMFPIGLQKRLLVPFADALERAGHGSYRSELEDFRNTTIKVRHNDPEAPAPTVDLVSPASARDILRADLSESDLDPNLQTPHSPESLPLAALDTLRIERRNTPAEADLLDEVLERHVAEGNFFVVIGLLLDSSPRIPAERMDGLIEKHLLASATAMSDPELVAFVFRDALPPIPESVKTVVNARLSDLRIPPPPAFVTSSREAPVTVEDQTVIEVTPPELPTLVRAPDTPIPTFEDAEAMLEGSAAIRNAIESFINDTD